MGPVSTIVWAVTGDNAQADRTFAVDPAYRTRWSRLATLMLALAVLLGIGGVVALITGNGSAGALAVTLAVLAGIGGVLTRRGVVSTARARYELTVGPGGLVVVWRDRETRLPWTELEYATVVENGPLYRALEVCLRSGIHPDLPTNARPRPSKRSRDRLEVFVLSILGEHQFNCIGEISRYVTVR